MKIVIFVHTLLSGGAERVAANLANYWAHRNCEVTIVTLVGKDSDFYALHPSIGRVSLDLPGKSANALIALTKNVRRILALRRTLKRLRPDVALSMMSTPNVLLAFAAYGIRGSRAIGSERTYPPRMPVGRLWHMLRRIMYGKMAAVTAQTSESAEWIAAHTSARVVPVIPNPVAWPLAAHDPQIDPDAICPPGRKVLLAVGRLSEEKNLAMLMQEFAELAPRHPDWDLVILGEGPERRALEAMAVCSALKGRVFLPGITGNLAQWYARADLYVLCSRFEGFPNALAEALAHGLPAVSVDCDTGPRDIIRPNVDGLLVPPDDAGALRAALERVMGDSALRSSLARRATEARHRFSVERIATMWEDLFADLSGTARTAPRPGTQPAKKTETVS